MPTRRLDAFKVGYPRIGKGVIGVRCGGRIDGGVTAECSGELGASARRNGGGASVRFLRIDSQLSRRSMGGSGSMD